jgi:hypothetical protein
MKRESHTNTLTLIKDKHSIFNYLMNQTVDCLIYLFVVYLTTLFQQLRLYGVELKGHKWIMRLDRIWKETVVV